ncbi:general secretion pathway protein GspN [Luteibacter aegosomaticola]|uniref:general secretion pathway protein GspN n=1 Tax=Luteibacter aegosomaticola TaxID=2911538 RepID=UPI001FFA914C|nr:general secretion pathway protein GspN [Luteibacter aegosomaticola]UPG90649.1 general secretion pathway protein GspN [Luteibacter aegosomaticola]
MNAAGQRRLTPILAGIAIALAGTTAAFALGIGRGVHWDDPSAAEPLPPMRAAAMPKPSPLDQYAEVWQRPLFMADRKPVVNAGGDDDSSNIGDLELTGIIMTSDLHMALLRDKGKNTTVRVKEGAALEGHWTLASLTPRSAVFDNAGQRRELALKVAAPEPLAGQKPGTPPPPGQQPARPPQASADDGVRVIQPQGGGMTGPTLPHPPGANGGERNAPPRQDDADLQRARIEALKQAVQKRRLEQQQQQQRQQDSR